MRVLPYLGLTACDMRDLLKKGLVIRRYGTSPAFTTRTSIRPLRIALRKARRRTPSPCQSMRRGLFRPIKTLWNSLSPGDQYDWRIFALYTPVLNRCGQSYYLSDYRMFVHVNGPLSLFGPEYLQPHPPADLDPPPADVPFTLSYEYRPWQARPQLIAEHDAPAPYGFQLWSDPQASYPLPWPGHDSQLLYRTPGVESPLIEALENIGGYYNVGLFSIVGGVPEELTREHYVAVAGNKLYVTDQWFTRITIWDAVTYDYLGSFGTPGTGPGEFDTPHAVAVAGGIIFVTDQISQALQCYSESTHAYLRGNSLLHGTYLNWPTPGGVAVSGGIAYVVDINNARVLLFDASSAAYLSQFVLNPPDPYQVQNPNSITVANGRIYIGDRSTDYITVWYESTHGFITAFGGSTEHPGPTGEPIGVTLANSKLYCADGGLNLVTIWDEATLTYLGSFGSFGSGWSQFNRPVGIAMDGDTLYITDLYNGRMSVWFQPGRILLGLRHCWRWYGSRRYGSCAPAQPQTWQEIYAPGAYRPTVVVTGRTVNLANGVGRDVHVISRLVQL